MTTEIQFYHLMSTPLERALPKLLEKALAGGHRALVLAANEDTAEMLNNALWTYDPNSFLPHGTKKDGYVEQQPIYITHQVEAPNSPDLLVVTDGSAIDDLGELKKVLDIFDGADEQAVAAARKRWAAYKDAGHPLKYIRQTATGGWEQVSAA